MFQQTLLESSTSGRKRNRWPMLAGFAAEIGIAALLILIPLVTTGVLPLPSRVSPPIYTTTPMQVEASSRPVRSQAAGGPVLSGGQVYTIPTGNSHISSLTSAPASEPFQPGLPAIGNPGSDISSLLPSNARTAPEGPKSGPVHISHLSEGMLLRKVEPVYPRIAIVSRISGEVRLHALIGRGGSIEDLTVVSGHPILAGAARDAVSQWKYRPFILNGQAVEVETFIVVTFRQP